MKKYNIKEKVAFNTEVFILQMLMIAERNNMLSIIFK
jgi:hypothetical protein